MSNNTSNPVANSGPRYDYVISGLRVRSDVELRSAIPATHLSDPEVIIERQILPPAPDESQSAESGEGRSFWLRVASIGRFRIDDGRRIAYQPFPDADPGDLALHLIGTVFAVALQQRGNVVLHASAVSVDGHAMLFCGASGEGKSTLAAMLSSRGYPLLNDDVCNLSRRPDGTFVVRADGRMLKLWATSLQELHQESSGPPIRTGVPKFYAQPLSTDEAERPVKTLFILSTCEGGEDPTMQRMTLAQAMVALRESAFRPGLVAAMGQHESYFRTSVELCRQAELYLLRRPKDFGRAEAVLDLLETHWKQSSR